LKGGGEKKSSKKKKIKAPLHKKDKKNDDGVTRRKGRLGKRWEKRKARTDGTKVLKKGGNQKKRKT